MPSWWQRFIMCCAGQVFIQTGQTCVSVQLVNPLDTFQLQTTFSLKRFYMRMKCQSWLWLKSSSQYSVAVVGMPWFGFSSHGEQMSEINTPAAKPQLKQVLRTALWGLQEDTFMNKCFAFIQQYACTETKEATLVKVKCSWNKTCTIQMMAKRMRIDFF